MGSRTEKLLLEDAEEMGYAGIRVDFGTGYGFHNPHDAGDLIIGQGVEAEARNGLVGYSIYSNLYIIEEKYKATDANKYLQEDGEKFDAMIAFAEAIGATPVLACRWSTQVDWSPGATHFLIDAREVERTAAGNVSVKPETAKQEYQDTETFFD
jgi:Holliday junction resolvase